MNPPGGMFTYVCGLVDAQEPVERGKGDWR